jgi:hypothetical protein
MEPFRFPVPPLFFKADARPWSDAEQSEPKYQVSQETLLELRRNQVAHLGDYLVRWLLPPIARLGVADESSTIESLSAAKASPMDSRDPKSVLATYLHSSANNIKALQAREALGYPAEEIDLELIFLAIEQVACAAGVAAAIDSQQRKTIYHGARGRRGIGETTRGQIRLHALALPRRMSRASAAPVIADKLKPKLSPGRVLRLLSELYPGESWANRKDAESTDGSRLDD